MKPLENKFVRKKGTRMSIIINDGNKRKILDLESPTTIQAVAECGYDLDFFKPRSFIY